MKKEFFEAIWKFRISDDGTAYDEKSRKRGVFILFPRYEIKEIPTRSPAGEVIYYVVEDNRDHEVLDKCFTREECEKFLEKNYPDYQDPMAYWD